MDYLPIFLNIKQQRCLVVGGGDVALRKIHLLLAAKANVVVVSPEIHPEINKLADENKLSVKKSVFDAEDISDVKMVIAATNDTTVNEYVYQLCDAKNIPVNVVDNPPLCSFIFPAIVDRDPLTIAISSAGKSPVLARLLRSKIEAEIPSRYGNLAKICGEFRVLAKQQLPEANERRLFWEKHLQGHFAELVFTGNDDSARNFIQKELLNVEKKTTGEVYLVGAGPGDPDLLTFRALRLMQQSDVIVYDRLVSKGILELCRRDADRIYVGKKRNDHTLPQENINELLVRLAQEGRRVCRLKGGDPFIFGRGGEEIEELAAANIPFQVVPGITAANGCSTYAGIPLTHRDFAYSVRFITGHLKNGTADLPWSELIHPNQTLVIYMGLVGLEEICHQLMAHGMLATMPIALISKGTTPDQKVIVATVATMTEKIKNESISAPTLTIIGEVVSLRNKLNWYQN